MPIDLNALRTAAEALIKVDLAIAWPEAKQSYLDRMATAIADAAVECGDAANGVFDTGVTAATASIAVLSNSLAAAGNRNVFDSASYSAFVENTDWRRLCSDDGIVFTTDGRLTISQSGRYRIGATLLLVSSTTINQTLTITKNGSIVHTMTAFVHSAVDPVERTIEGIFDAAPGDYFEVYCLPAGGTTQFGVGCTLFGQAASGVQGDSIVWEGPWVTATPYQVLDAVENDGSSYICKLVHTSSPSDEPGVGGSWTTYWDLVAQAAASTAAGADTEVQFNDGMAIGADSRFIWNKVTPLLGVIADMRIGPTSPVATSAGRRYLTIQGSAGAGVLEMLTAEAEADAVRVGGVQFTDVNSTEADKRVAGIFASLRGPTATKRGGDLFLYTKADNVSGLFARQLITEAGLTHFGAALSTSQTVGGIGSRVWVQRSTGLWGLSIEGEGTNQSDLLFRTPNNTADYRIVQLVNISDYFEVRRLTDIAGLGQSLLKLDMARSGELSFGSGIITYPTTPTISTAALIFRGATSDVRMTIQGGDGRFNTFWNAYYESPNHKYLVSGEGATRYYVGGQATEGHRWFVAPLSVSAGDVITWLEAMRVDLGGYFYLMEQASSPATPGAGFANIYPKTDNNLYFKNDAGDEFNVSAGQTFINAYSGGSYAGAAPRYYAIDGIPLALNTEAPTQIRIRGPGRIGRVRIYIETNTIAGSTTDVNLRINGATVITLTVPASGIGEYTSSTIVAYANDDLVNWQITSAAAGTMTIRVMQADCL